MSAPAEPPAVDERALGAALRAGGALIALGYLFGLVQGPVVAVAGGVGIMTVGRLLHDWDRRSAALAGAALAGYIVAWGIGGLRWSSLALGDIRGAQAVIGPTLATGDAWAVAGAWLAGAGAVLATAVWLAVPSSMSRWSRALDAVPVALATGAVLWGPSLDPAAGLLSQAAPAFAAIALAWAVPLGLVELTRRAGDVRILPALTCIALVCVLAGGGLVALGS